MRRIRFSAAATLMGTTIVALTLAPSVQAAPEISWDFRIIRERAGVCRDKARKAMQAAGLRIVWDKPVPKKLEIVGASKKTRAIVRCDRTQRPGEARIVVFVASDQGSDEAGRIKIAIISFMLGL